MDLLDVQLSQYALPRMAGMIKIKTRHRERRKEGKSVLIGRVEDHCLVVLQIRQSYRQPQGLQCRPILQKRALIIANRRSCNGWVALRSDPTCYFLLDIRVGFRRRPISVTRPLVGTSRGFLTCFCVEKDDEWAIWI